ncbi:MAG: hypothetical protein Q9168_003582 [Polycauliona sp. 1 TL-2023]
MSLLIAGSVFAYEKYKDSKAKRATRKAEKASRFSELEAENQKRIELLQKNTPFCNTSDWQGGGCPGNHPNDRVHDDFDGGNAIRDGERPSGEEPESAITAPRHVDQHEVDRQGMRRTDTFATTGTAEDDIFSRQIDSHQVNRQGIRRTDTFATTGTAEDNMFSRQIDSHQVDRQGIRRTDTFATTGTAEYDIIDSYHHPAPQQRNQEREEEEEGELVRPDVSHIVPPKYEDVRMRMGGGPCKRTFGEKVLRKKVVCGEREVVR